MFFRRDRRIVDKPPFVPGNVDSIEKIIKAYAVLTLSTLARTILHDNYLSYRSRRLTVIVTSDRGFIQVLAPILLSSGVSRPL